MAVWDGEERNSGVLSHAVPGLFNRDKLKKGLSINHLYFQNPFYVIKTWEHLDLFENVGPQVHLVNLVAGLG